MVAAATIGELFLQKPPIMKRLSDYLGDANHHLNGMRVDLDLLRKSPKDFVPQAIIFALFVEGTIRLATAKADWIAYVALLIGTLAFASIIALLTKKKK